MIGIGIPNRRWFPRHIDMSMRDQRLSVHIKIYRDLDPFDRYNRFHKPLDAALLGAGLGEVTGGGTLEDMDTGNVLFSDLHVLVSGDVHVALGVIRTILVEAGAPLDTELCVEGMDHAIRIESH